MTNEELAGHLQDLIDRTRMVEQVFLTFIVRNLQMELQASEAPQLTAIDMRYSLVDTLECLVPETIAESDPSLADIRAKAEAMLRNLVGQAEDLHENQIVS